jgi:pyrimidine-nucleoside phosphorylase
MSDYSKAVELAKTLIKLGEASGKTTVAYISDMSNPLGKAVGNWLEILECIECLQGDGPDDLMQVTHRLAGTMICLGDKAESIDEGIEISKQKIESGLAWQKFIEIVNAQNGDVQILKTPEIYPQSVYQLDYTCDNSGWIESIDALTIGILANQLGAGRQQAHDQIDSKAGILFYHKAGDKIEAGTTICTLYTDHKEKHDTFLQAAAKAIRISIKPAAAPHMILDYFDKTNL